MVGLGGGGADGAGARVAEAGAAGGDHSLSAQYCRCETDAGAAERSAALCVVNSVRCVDVEGGTVDRLRDALAPMPVSAGGGTGDDDHSSQRAMMGHEEDQMGSQVPESGPGAPDRSGMRTWGVGWSRREGVWI